MLNLVVTMAGRGSRFSRNGEFLPKPLIDLKGHPFFWWAVESVRRNNDLASLSFVVLREHVEAFGLDGIIYASYPEARIVMLDSVTKGAAETAMIALERIGLSEGAVGFLDCDHAFDVGDLSALVSSIEASDSGALCFFRSESSAYSYISFDENSRVSGTVEKKVVSDCAIAGFYLFGSTEVFREQYLLYKETCPYDELFMSGIYDRMIRHGVNVMTVELTRHLSFGTPEELATVLALSESTLPKWMQLR